MPSQAGSISVQSFLERMQSSDKDFRFMATNDLMGKLQRQETTWDEDGETRITHQIIDLLQDKNGEVQNLAVKCLGYLVSKIKDERRQLVITSLCKMLRDKSDQVRDIASIALKTIVSEIPINKRMIDIINEYLNPHLSAAIANNQDINLQLESLDILAELISRVGSQLDPAYHERFQADFITLLNSDRSAVRKKSMNALSQLLACCSDSLYHKTLEQLYQSLHEQSKILDQINDLSNNIGLLNTAKTLLHCVSIVIRNAGHRASIEQLDNIIPVISSLCSKPDDELREFSLQVYESYVRRCPVNTKGLIPEIIQACLTYLSFDPNYNYDAGLDDEETMDTGDAQEDDNSDFGDDYSDDDDLSWKVRRASAKCLEAMVTNRRDLVSYFYLNVAPTLVSRFKEREETVRADIIQIFVSLLKQTRLILNDSKIQQLNDTKDILIRLLPDIVTRSSLLMRSKLIRNRQLVFQIFIELMGILPRALSEYIPTLVPAILFSLTDKNSNSNMKIDALVFLQELVKNHEPSAFYQQIPSLMPPILAAVDDTFYKISTESIILMELIVSVMRPTNCEPMQGYESILTSIYDKILDRIASNGVSAEIKEKAISCMGQIIATYGDKMQQQLPVALELINEKLKNEANRLTCVKALNRISNSKLEIPLAPVFPKAFPTLSSFLRKSSRPLKIATLMLIENVILKSQDVDADSAKMILTEVPSLISESDLYISQLSLMMVTTLIQTQKASHQAIPDQIITATLNLIKSPLLQGSALQAMLQFFSTIVVYPISGVNYPTLMSRLLQPIYQGDPIHKQTYYSTAKAIASISLIDDSKALSSVQQLINDFVKHKNNDNIYSLILLSLGEIGRHKDLANVSNLLDIILEAFNSSSEDVKSAGSYALGCVAVGNLDKFLPIILHEIEARNKRQYLILHSLREVISSGCYEKLGSVWQLLMKHCECQEEGTRNVVSECLGKLTLLKPAELLPKLIEHSKVDFAMKPLARATIVAAIKFIISDQPQEIDDLLRKCIGEFLIALQDENINVRRVALTTFNSAAHNKPSLVIDLLPQILPLLYHETLVKPELIREVEMGPFKHQVDDGLDLRKAAYECMYTLLDTCQSHLDIFEFLTHVENGLGDHYDIKMLTYLMLNKLASLCPSSVLQRMDNLIRPIEDVCRTKPKENAVKQEHEKQDELKRSAFKAVDALRSIPGANKHPVLVRFFESFVQSNKDLADLYTSIHRDAVTMSNQKMDLS